MLFNGDLLQYKDVGSVEPAANEGGLDDTGLEECDDSAVAVEAVGEESEGKKDPSTRLALSREASFITSSPNFEGLRGGFVALAALRSRAALLAGRREICIACGRRCLGRQRGAGKPGGCEVSVDTGGV